jgi:hypothetical protein
MALTSPEVRSEYLYALKQYVAKAFALSQVWECINLDEKLSNAVDGTTFPFAMSFDEYCYEMLAILKSLEEKLDGEAS